MLQFHFFFLTHSGMWLLSVSCLSFNKYSNVSFSHISIHVITIFILFHLVILNRILSSGDFHYHMEIRIYRKLTKNIASGLVFKKQSLQGLIALWDAEELFSNLFTIYSWSIHNKLKHTINYCSISSLGVVVVLFDCSCGQINNLKSKSDSNLSVIVG